MSDPSASLLAKRRTREMEDEDEGVTEYGSGIYRYPPYLQPGHFSSLEKLMFFLSSILLIILFIFVGLYARSSQDTDSTLPSPHIPHNKTQYCLTPDCIMTAAQLLQDVDTTLNPCDDFYAYTCNHWIRQHSLPDLKTDRHLTLAEDIRSRHYRILIQDFDSLYPPTDGLPDPQRVLDQQLFSKLKDFYSSCMHSTSTDLSPLYSVFRELREFLPLENTGLTHALQSLAKRNIWALFSVEHTGSMLTLSPVQLGLPSRAHYDNDSIMRVYTEVVSGILDILFKKDTEFGWKSWSAVATARRIVEFEKQLVKVMEVPPQPERWTLQDLQQASPNILWSEFFPPTVSVYSAQFIRRLSDDVLRDINTRTVQMYFIWRTVWKYVTVMGDEYNVPKKKLDVMLYGVRAIPERWEMCVDTMDKSPLGLLMGRYFVSKHPLEVSKAEDMAREMVNELRSRVDTWPWIGPDDNKTRSEIMKKLNTMKFQIGYSTPHPDITSVISLSDYYSDIQMDPNDFLGNTIQINRHDAHYRLNQLVTPWNAHSLDTIYYPETNKIIIPGGWLQLPFYDPNGPRYLNIGTLGWLIGRHIMHAFDETGRRYNSQGILGDWWTHESQHHLDKLNECLMTQYRNHGESHLNSSYFADNGAIMMSSYLGMEDEHLLPGLGQWSREQLYYIQFGRMQCGNYKSPVSASHRLRVNIPLMNSHHFSETFQCAIGFNMNPAVKCQMW